MSKTESKIPTIVQINHIVQKATTHIQAHHSIDLIDSEGNKHVGKLYLLTKIARNGCYAASSYHHPDLPDIFKIEPITIAKRLIKSDIGLGQKATHLKLVCSSEES